MCVIGMVTGPAIKPSEAEKVYDGYWRAGVPHGRGTSSQTPVTQEDKDWKITFEVGTPVASNYKVWHVHVCACTSS